MKRQFNFFLILLLLQFSLKAQQGGLFLLAGQSNGVGGGDSTKSPQCIPGTAFEFDAAANDFIPLKDPVGKAWKLFHKSGTGSVSPSFAKRLNELTNPPIYMVTAARGGASCNRKAELGNYDTWDMSGNLFDQAVEKTKMAEVKSGVKEWSDKAAMVKAMEWHNQWYFAYYDISQTGKYL